MTRSFSCEKPALAMTACLLRQVNALRVFMFGVVAWGCGFAARVGSVLHLLNENACIVIHKINSRIMKIPSEGDGSETKSIEGIHV